MIADTMWDEAKQREAEKEQAAYWAACCIRIDAVHKLITDDAGARLSWYHMVDSCVPEDAAGPWNAQQPSRYHPWLYAPSVLESFLENLRAEEDVEEVVPVASADAQDDEGDSDQSSGAENLPEDVVHKLITDDEGARLSWYRLVDSCVPEDASGPWNAQSPSRYLPWLYQPSMLEKFLENFRAK